MRKCDNQECINNNSYADILCPECFSYMLMHEFSVDELMLLYVETKKYLDDPALYKIYCKQYFGDDLELDDIPLENQLEAFKNNLFELFNNILKARE